jgi:hypothetical protein
MNNRHQSFPKFMYGLAGYGPTFATAIAPILYVACHGTSGKTSFDNLAILQVRYHKLLLA